MSNRDWPLPEVEHDFLAHQHGSACRGCEQLGALRDEAKHRYHHESRFFMLVSAFAQATDAPQGKLEKLITLVHALLPPGRDGRAQGPVRRLRCSSCGADVGRWSQHWNRDTGYGVCTGCVATARARGASPGEIANLYGAEGVNWGDLG